MTFDRTLAISNRVIRQIVKDHRSLTLIIVAPVVVMSLVGFSLVDQEDILNRIAPALLGVFVLFFTFLLTGVSFLRERSQGTLERLHITPVSRADLLVGYLIGFLLFAMLQSLQENGEGLQMGFFLNSKMLLTNIILKQYILETSIFFMIKKEYRS